MNGSKRRGKEEVWGWGRDEQTHPILIPGQAGVHSCCCSHSRAWIWQGKGSINLLMLQQAAYWGAAVRNALSRVRRCGSPLPLHACMRAHTCASVYMSRGGGGCAQAICLQTSLQAPREGGAGDGEDSIARALWARASRSRAQPVVHLHPVQAHTSICCWGPVHARKAGAHVQARLGRCSPSFSPLGWRAQPFSPPWR